MGQRRQSPKMLLNRFASRCSQLKPVSRKTALNRLADMFDMFMQAFIALGDKRFFQKSGTVAEVSACGKAKRMGLLTDEIKG